MYSDFFREDKPQRLSNPTFMSNHILETMALRYDLHLKQAQHRQPEIIFHKEKQKSSKNQSNIEKNPQEYVTLPTQRQKRSKSNLASYGSHSLKHMKKISDEDVYMNQQRKYDIVSGASRDINQKRQYFPFWKKSKPIPTKITEVESKKDLLYQ